MGIAEKVECLKRKEQNHQWHNDVRFDENVILFENSEHRLCEYNRVQFHLLSVKGTVKKGIKPNIFLNYCSLMQS